MGGKSDQNWLDFIDEKPMVIVTGRVRSLKCGLSENNSKRI